MGVGFSGSASQSVRRSWQALPGQKSVKRRDLRASRNSGEGSPCEGQQGRLRLTAQRGSKTSAPRLRGLPPR